MTREELDFLRESNNIESEWDDKSLQDAVLAWQYCKEQDQLTREVVLETHRLLMASRTTIEDKDKGAFRTGAVYIGGHEAKPFYAIENLLHQWLENVNDLVQRTHTEDPFNAKIIQEHHVQYEALHPFFDGNGRTGRIFYNWQRLKVGLPIHVIHVGKEQSEYYKWFR